MQTSQPAVPTRKKVWGHMAIPPRTRYSQDVWSLPHPPCCLVVVGWPRCDSSHNYADSQSLLIYPSLGTFLGLHARPAHCISSPLGQLKRRAGSSWSPFLGLDPQPRRREPPQGLHWVEELAQPPLAPSAASLPPWRHAHSARPAVPTAHRWQRLEGMARSPKASS